MAAAPDQIKHVDANSNTACVMCNSELPRRPAVYCSFECQKQDASASVAQRHGFYEYMGKWGPPWDQTRRPNDLLVEPVTEINTKVGRRPLPRRWQAPPASQKVVAKSASTGPTLELRENDTKLKGERYKIVEYQDPRVRTMNPLNISTSMTPIPKEITVMDSMKSVDGHQLEWYAYDKKKWWAVCIVDAADEKILDIRSINLRMNVSLTTAWDQTERSEGNPSTLPDDDGLYWFGAIRPRESGKIKVLFSADDLDTAANKISVEDLSRSVVVADRKKPAKTTARKSKSSMKQLTLHDLSTSRVLQEISGLEKSPANMENNISGKGKSVGEDSEGWVSAHSVEKVSKAKKRKAF